MSKTTNNARKPGIDNFPIMEKEAKEFANTLNEEQKEAFSKFLKGLCMYIDRVSADWSKTRLW